MSNNILIAAAIGVGLLAATATPAILKKTRGLRNNNPGNIEKGRDRWQGMALDQSGDDRFIQFTHPLYGIRAMARILVNYNKRAGLQTIEEFINRWAPSIENDTESYIDSVAKQTGLLRHQTVNVNNSYTMTKLVKAIIKHENGVQPYSDALIKDGVRLGIA